MKWKRMIIPLFIPLFFPPHWAYASHPSLIKIESIDSSISIDLTGMNEVSGASIATTDLGEDGVEEWIIANGMGLEPRVHIFRQDGSEIRSFLAYAPSLGVGMNVTSCDLTGDGYNEIVVAPQRGGGPHVRVFDRFGSPIDAGGFFAYTETMREGINLACGDLLGDERAELVTLPAAGGGSHVRIWSWEESPRLVENFFAFHASDRSGLVGVIHDRALIVAQQFTSTPTMKTIVIHTSPEIKKEETWTIDGLGIESMTVVDDELLFSTSSTSTIYNVTQKMTTPSPVAHPNLTAFHDSLITIPGRLLFTSHNDAQRIEVDISEQRLYAFESGILRNSFLISSGLNNSTPLGDHSVLAKIPLVHYTWNYGENDPRNYDLGLVPYNLRIYPHIYIHYAYWHNNFGHPMSHGCVNVNFTNMQWLYEWAQEDILVEVRS